MLNVCHYYHFYVIAEKKITFTQNVMFYKNIFTNMLDIRFLLLSLISDSGVANTSWYDGAESLAE